MFVYPVLYAIFLWWFTTGLLIAVYKRSAGVMRSSFLGATAILILALWGIYATRDLSGLRDVYIAITCGVLIWGWQTASYYMGFVTGPGHTEPDLNNNPLDWERSLSERLQLAFSFTIYHELVVIGIGLVLMGLTWSGDNRWGLWIYLTLWLMHFSAKLNVFLGVRNFSIDALPSQMQYIGTLLTKRNYNALFPISVVVASSIGFTLIYQGIEPGTSPAATAGFLFIGTMIALGVIEHWMMVLPLPATLVGFNMHPVQATTNTSRPAASLDPSRRIRRTYTFERDIGPFVVDVWEAHQDSGKSPVLLVHGWGNSGNYWHNMAHQLSQSVQVIVPDLPGTGRSQPVQPPQDMYDQVASLAWLLDELEIEQVQLVGHSMGGAMSLLLSEKHPERIERILLTSLSFFLNKRQQTIYRGVMQVYRFSLGFRPKWLASVPLLPEIMATRYFHRVPNEPELLQVGLRDYLTLDAQTAIACAMNATDDSIPRAGAAVQVPTLLVACREDNVMPLDNVDYTIRTIPGCEVRWIEGCGHLPMVEKPDEYMAILRDFLNVS